LFAVFVKPWSNVTEMNDANSLLAGKGLF